ncbi:MAG: TIGR02300 family protein [Roseibium sp.]|nr:TIGR02300 family protein [Roseibium sp.]
MAKPDLGTKRLCPSCGAKYYDLNRDPITCPKCGTVFEVVMTSRAAKAAKVEEKPAEDEAEEDAAAPELVTLEEADAEAEGASDDVPDIDGDDVDLEDESSDDEDVFIDEEDEDDEAVPGIRVEIDDDTDR